MKIARQILADILLILKIVGDIIYYNLEAFVKFFIPLKYKCKDVNGNVVLITGAAGGIGRLIAQMMLERGCIIVAVDKNKDELDRVSTSLKASINDQTGRVYTYVCDMTQRNDILGMLCKIREDVGTVHILINNAGIMNRGRLFVDLEYDELQRIFDLNVMSQLWLCKELLPDMIERNSGHIVNMASICGIIGGYKLTDYCASKFAVVGFTESLRIELNTSVPDNAITVSVVCPFHVRTSMFLGCDFTKLTWLNLSMEPEYVAKQIVNGILTNSEMIMLPRFAANFFTVIRYMLSTKSLESIQKNLNLSGSMDNYNDKKLN